MVTTITKALNHPLIKVLDRNNELGIIKFRLGEIPTLVTLRVVREHAAKYSLEVSHRMSTPMQPHGSLPAFRDCSSPGVAVRELVRDFIRIYETEIKSGRQPDETWLVPNKYFLDR